MTAKEETKAVKQALAKAGIVARVGHGTGTAAWWLHIIPQYTTGEDWRELTNRCIRIAQAVTGRRGDYDGQINVYLGQP